MSRAPLIRPSALACLALALAVLSARPTVAAAQGNLSSQGTGYPPGQISARSEGTGGALGEIDPMSALNPATIWGFGVTTLFLQMEPEFRVVTTNGTAERTTTARFPLLSAGIPFGARWMLGLSSSTLLDRTWETSVRSSSIVGSDTVGGTTTYRSDGSVNDLRVAGAYALRPDLHVGLGFHTFSGNTRFTLGRRFSDTLQFVSFSQDRVVSYSGNALSIGGEYVAAHVLSLAGSYRRGGKLKATAGDTLVLAGDAPDRYGLSVAFIGLAGTTIAARTSHESWSAMKGFGAAPATSASLSASSTPLTEPVDAWDSAVGADITGPRFGDFALMLRAGGRWRTLPFTAAGREVRERSLSGGLGTALAGGRMSADVAFVHAIRDAGLSVNERAWTLSVGVAVRP